MANGRVEPIVSRRSLRRHGGCEENQTEDEFQAHLYPFAELRSALDEMLKSLLRPDA